MTAATDIPKGLVVTVLCIVGALLQLEVGFDSVEELPFTLVALMMIGAPLGVGFGALMGHLRTDRVLVVIAAMLGTVSLLLLVGGVDGDGLEWHSRVFTTYPWIFVGALVLGRWTRRPALTVPAMRLRARRILPQLRPLTVVEISTLLSVLCAFVIALGADAPPRYVYDDIYVDYSTPTTLQLIGLFVTMAVPAGVGLGKVAEALPRWRWLLLLLIAFVGAGYAWTIAIGILDTIEFAAWSPLLIAGTAIAIERLTAQGGNATSREAGSTSTTP